MSPAPGSPAPQGSGAPSADPYLRALRRQCLAIEALLDVEEPARQRALQTWVRGCPGWSVADLLQHLAGIERLVPAWLAAGRRPLDVPPGPDDPLEAFSTGWRALEAALAAGPGDTRVATWSPFDTTLRFWRRRQAHEHAVHALDITEVLAPTWHVDDAFALDGVDEVLRLWLGTRLGTEIGGDGSLVRLASGGRAWNVAMHRSLLEVHELPVPPAADAVVRALPRDLYRWVWGRGGTVEVEGDTAAVERLVRLLRRATA